MRVEELGLGEGATSDRALGALPGAEIAGEETPKSAGAFRAKAVADAQEGGLAALEAADAADEEAYAGSPTGELRERLEYGRLEARARLMAQNPDRFGEPEFDAVFRELNRRRFIADDRTLAAFGALDGEGGATGLSRLKDFLDFSDRLAAAKDATEAQEMLGERFMSPELRAWRAAQADGTAVAYARRKLDEAGRSWGDKVAGLREMLPNPNEAVEYAVDRLSGKDAPLVRPPDGKPVDSYLVGHYLSDERAVREYEKRLLGDVLRNEAAKVAPFLTGAQRNLVNLAASGADMEPLRGVFRLMRPEDREMMYSMCQAVRPEADLNWLSEMAVRAGMGVRSAFRGAHRADIGATDWVLNKGGEFLFGKKDMWSTPEEREAVRKGLLDDIHWAEAVHDIKLKDPESFVRKALEGYADSASLQYSMLGGAVMKQMSKGMKGTWGGAALGAGGAALEGYAALSMIGEQFDNMLLHGIDIDRAGPLAVCGGLIDSYIETMNFRDWFGKNLSPAEMKRVGVRAGFRAALKLDGREFMRVLRTNAKQAFKIAGSEVREELLQGMNQAGWCSLAEGRAALDAFTSSDTFVQGMDAFWEALPTCTAFGVFGAANPSGSVAREAGSAYSEHLQRISRLVAKKNGIDDLNSKGEALACRAAQNEAARIVNAVNGISAQREKDGKPPMTKAERNAWINSQTDLSLAEKEFYAEHCDMYEASVAQDGQAWADAHLSGSVNEAIFAKAGWKFSHDAKGRIDGVTTAGGREFEVDFRNREARPDDFTDGELGVFVEEWNSQADGDERLSGRDDPRLAEAVKRVNGLYAGGRIVLFGARATDGTLGHEAAHGILDGMARLGGKAARRELDALARLFGGRTEGGRLDVAADEAVALDIEGRTEAAARANAEAAPDAVDVRALGRNVVTALRKAVGLGSGRVFLPVVRTAGGVEANPEEYLGVHVAEAMAQAAERERLEGVRRREMREARAARKALREEKRQRKIALRKADSDAELAARAEDEEAWLAEEERKDAQMLENRRRALKAPPRLEVAEGEDDGLGRRVRNAYAVIWKSRMGQPVTQEEADRLGEDYGLPPEALNLVKGEGGYRLADGQVLSDASLARLQDGFMSLYAEIYAARIAVPDVVVSTAEEAANAVPNEVYDPLTDTFVEGRVVVDPANAKSFREQADAQSVTPEELDEARPSNRALSVRRFCDVHGGAFPCLQFWLDSGRRMIARPRKSDRSARVNDYLDGLSASDRIFLTGIGRGGVAWDELPQAVGMGMEGLEPEAILDRALAERGKHLAWKERGGLAPEQEEARAGARFSVSAPQAERDEVVARYTNPDGTKKPGWMKAPNGKPTRLTERQWVQVRTPAFKRWFGDWENDPANASKVVDENGEPLVVYHGHVDDFTVFKPSERGKLGKGVYLSAYKEKAGRYSRIKGKFGYGHEKVMSLFVNIRNPYVGSGERYDEGLRNALTDNSYDGIISDKNMVEIVARNPAQVKSATDNTGAFDAGNPDIRFSVRLAPELRETLTLEPSDEATAKASVKAWRAERKAFTNRRNGRTAELKADWTKIFSEPAKKKSANYAAHYAAANRLDTLFENGVRMWDEPPRNGSRDIRAYAKYGCPFEFGGETYLAKITVKEYADGKSTDGFYSIEAISVEKISAGGINAGITSIEGHELDPGATAVLKNMLQQTPHIVPNAAAERNGGDVRFSVGRLYTGSAADYERPSLHAVGTGEGTQVYGWGLYASDRRGVAEGYANSDAKRRASTPDEMWPKYKGKFDSELEHDPVRTFALKYVAREGSVDAAIQFLRTDDWTERAAPKAREAAEWLEKNRDDVTPPQTPSEHLYEQTWFTDRAPGDESHLLKWYEMDNLKPGNLLHEQLKWIRRQAKAEGVKLPRDLGSYGMDVYETVANALGSPKAASEFLARAGIDGVKYPVDSYGGKAVKDGDEAGWNYVSFRDDNIRVDHKWTDGQMRFSITSAADDAAYMDAVRLGDMETARRLLKAAWERSGYSPDTSYKDAHAAPSAPVEAKDFKNVEALNEARDEGWDLNLWAIAKGITGQPDDFFSERGPRLYMYNDAAGRETQAAIASAIQSIRGGNDNARIIVYRAVPKGVKFDGLQSGGQWVSPSKTYAENHGKSRFGFGEYRIVREVVKAENLWWDGNDAREWGYDDGRQYVYRNAENGMKLATVTYDDAGNVIPLSQRFDQQNPDIRFSLRVNPRLRDEVEAALNTDRAKGEVVKGGRRIVFCESPRLFEAIGIPRGTVYTKAHTLRKIAKEHALTAGQIASAPELLERPAAVFDDNGEGYVFLTDATAPDRNGIAAPIMAYVRPDGSGNYIASVYSRTEAAEMKYVNLVNAGKVLYIDKDKVAQLPLRGEALSSLSTFSVGDDVKTPEDLSSWSSPRIVPQYGPAVQGAARPGEASARYSIGGRSAENVAKFFLAREIMENGGRLPDTRRALAVARALNCRVPAADLLRGAEAEAARQTKVLRYLASDPKAERAIARAGLALRHERAIERARAAAIQFSREVSEAAEGTRRAAERAVRLVRGEDYERMVMREGLDLDAILKAIRPPTREEAAARGEAVPEPGGTPALDDAARALVAERAAEAVRNGAEAVAKAKEALAGKRDAAKAEEAAGGQGASAPDVRPDGGGDERGGAVAQAVRAAIAKAGFTLDSPEAMVQLVKAITEKYIKDFPAEFNNLDVNDVWSSPLARAKFAANLASFAQDVASAYAPSYARIRIAKKAQALDDKGLNTMRMIEKVGEELFRDLHKDIIRQSREGLIKDIKKLLKPHATHYTENELKQERKGVESALGRYCKFAYRVIRYSAKECEERAAELEQELAAWSGVADAEKDRIREFADRKTELEMIDMFGNLKDRMPSELEALRDFVEQTINESRWEVMQYGEKWEAARTEAAEKICRGIVGNPKKGGVKPEDGEVGGLYSLIGMMETKARQLTRWATGAEREESLKAFGAVEEMIQRAEDVQYNYMQVAKARFVDLCRTCYGSESAAAEALSAEIDPALWDSLNRGEQKTAWTIGRVMQMYVSCVQPDYADNCAKWGRDAAYVRHLEDIINSMHPKHLEFLNGLRGIYREQGDDLNEVMQKTTGTMLLTPNRLYMPVKMFRNDNISMKGRARAYNPFAPSLTPRIRNGLDFRQDVDVIDLWQERLEDAAHTIAWADTGSMVQGILQSDRVLRAIRDCHGDKVLGQWQRYVLDILAGAEQGRIDSSNWGVAAMRFCARLASRTWLMLNPASWAKQMSAVPCFALSMDGNLRDVAKSVSFVALHPFQAAKVMKDLSETSAFKARYGVAISQEMKYATTDKGRFSTWKDRLVDLAMSGMMEFDEFGVYALAGVYHNRRCELEAQGKSAKEASELASSWLMHIVDKTAQTTRTLNTTELQRAGGAWGILLQFKSAPAQQTQFEIVAIQEALAHPEDAKRWKRAAACIVINHLIVPTINTAIESMLSLLTSWGIPDEDKRRRLVEMWIANIVSGSLGSVVFLGTIVEGVGNLLGKVATDGEVNAYDLRNSLGRQIPAAEMLNLWVNQGDRAIRALHSLSDGDIQEGVEELAFAVGAVIPGVSWASRKARQALESAREGAR